MTISCRCPKCDAICAFYDKNAGRVARCRACGQIFIIPSEDEAKPEKVKIEVEQGQPEPGFYRALLLDNWKIFFKVESITPLVFIGVLVIIRFLLVRSCCAEVVPEQGPLFFVEFTVRLAYLACLFAVTWGWLVGFYLNIIYETAFGIDSLPEFYLGTFLTFWWYVLKPFLIFCFTMFLVQLPYLIVRWLLGLYGITYETIWIAEFGAVTLLQVLFVGGVFCFPLAILTMAVGQDFTMLRPDWLFAPILKAPQPYLVLVALLLAASMLELHSPQLVEVSGETTITIAARLGANFSVHLFTILAMRAIGLFYRHYSCYLRW